MQNLKLLNKIGWLLIDLWMVFTAVAMTGVLVVRMFPDLSILVVDIILLFVFVPRLKSHKEKANAA